jgi:hypothetical protein
MRLHFGHPRSLPVFGLLAFVIAGCGSSDGTGTATTRGGATDGGSTSASTDSGAFVTDDSSTTTTGDDSSTTTTGDDSSTTTTGDDSSTTTTGDDSSTGASDGAIDDSSASDTGSTTTPVDSGALDSSAVDSGALDSGAVDSGTPPIDSGAASDAAADTSVPTDAGAPDAAGFVTAAHPRLPIVDGSNANTLATPTFVSVTFNATYGNPVATLDDFVATIGSQPYWSAATSEYGVGKPTVHAPVHLTEAAPGTIDDAGIQSWLAGKVTSGAAGFSDAAYGSIFVISYPAATKITDTAGHASCTAFGGYHGSTSARVGGKTIDLAYAVIPECPPAASTGDAGPAPSLLEVTTEAMSHELVEAVTDPWGNGPAGTSAGYVGTSTSGRMDPYVAWEIGIVDSQGGLELGDMCESFISSYFQPSGYSYFVQRTWSNANVRAGKDPCAPYHTGEAAYFLAQPIFDPNFATNEAMSPPVFTPVVTVGTGRFAGQTQGIIIPVGSTGTVPVIFWSDAPTSAWTAEAVDVSVDNGGAAYLSLSLDKTTGNNGDKANLTIKVLSADTTHGGETFRITSTDGVLRHTTYGFVGQH